MHHQCVDVCTKGIWETTYAEEGDWLVDTEGMEVVSGEEDCQIECGEDGRSDVYKTRKNSCE